MQATTGTTFATCRANLREGVLIRNQRRPAASGKPYHRMIQQHSSIDGIHDLASSLRPDHRLDIHLQYKAGIPLRSVGGGAIVMRSTGLQTLPDGRQLSSQRLSFADGFLAELDHDEREGHRVVPCARPTARPSLADRACRQASKVPSIFALRQSLAVRSRIHEKVSLDAFLHDHFTSTASGYEQSE